uniref:Uncharacterized protein n=1 Tax=Anguilla anguilla TaxID=7936 RepID=A0A0E9RCY7_ANGAN
MPYEVAGR